MTFLLSPFVSPPLSLSRFPALVGCYNSPCRTKVPDKRGRKSYFQCTTELVKVKLFMSNFILSPRGAYF